MNRVTPVGRKISKLPAEYFAIPAVARPVKIPFLSNCLIFVKQFITYIVILYNHNSIIEIKINLRWSCTLTDRVGGRTVGETLKAASGSDTWDLGGQCVGRYNLLLF